jgi:hypothetical protein
MSDKQIVSEYYNKYGDYLEYDNSIEDMQTTQEAIDADSKEIIKTLGFK